MRVHDVADIADSNLEHAMRRWICDHDRGEIGAMRLGLGAKVGEIDVALVVAGDDYDPHAGHMRGRGVGPVRRRGDQADVAMGFAAARVVRADDEQARVLALRSRIGLQRDRRVAGRRAEHALQPGDHLAIAFGLVGGSERDGARRCHEPVRARDRREETSIRRCAVAIGARRFSATRHEETAAGLGGC